MNQLEISFGSPLRIIVATDEPPAITQRLTIRYDAFTLTCAGGEVMYTLPITHRVQMEVTYVDAKGNPATIDGEVSWQSSDSTLATVTPDNSDSSIVLVTPVGPTGQVQITASADADLGQGVKTLLTTCDIFLAAGEAVTGTVSPLGAPEVIP